MAVVLGSDCLSLGEEGEGDGGGGITPNGCWVV